MYIVFVKQKRAYETRISDWSSNVWSSDLTAGDDETLSRLLRRRCRAALLQPSQKPFADFALTGAEQPDRGTVRHTGTQGFDGATLFHHAPPDACSPPNFTSGASGLSRPNAWTSGQNRPFPHPAHWKHRFRV